MESTHAPAAPKAQHGLTPRTYIVVFGWLAIMTVVEVAIAAAPLLEAVKVPLLVALAVIKAALVVLFYMHLLHDSKWYWLLLMMPIFFVVLLTRFLILLH